GFRVGGGPKGKENDVSATFRSLAEYKFYPNPEPSRVPVHGDLLDNMMCPSTEQIMLVEGVTKKSGKRIKTYHDLKKHDMNEQLRRLQRNPHLSSIGTTLFYMGLLHHQCLRYHLLPRERY
ncbi:unnamed protein product, partial [Meganyctiphanes norvegica]